MGCGCGKKHNTTSVPKTTQRRITVDEEIARSGIRRIIKRPKRQWVIPLFFVCNIVIFNILFIFIIYVYIIIFLKKT